MQDHEHPTPTRRSGYRYLFTVKHHGGGSSDAARWSLEVGEDDEFSVFDTADQHEVSDDRNWLYGVLRTREGELRDVGTLGQQIAEFPLANEGQPWHGYPIWAISEVAPARLRGEKHRPTKDVFAKLLLAGLITRRQYKRLWKGKHA